MSPETEMSKSYGETKLGCNLDAKAFDLRTKLTDAGSVAKPAGAPPPSSKGSISYPKPVGKGK